MASKLHLSTILLLLLFTIINTTVITAVPEREYYSMLSALRFRGYHLFANAITTTDLHYDIIHGDNFTFFAPVDSALYALDMIMSAADYTTALRFHGVPNRLSLLDIRKLPYGSNAFPTLVKGHEIHIVNRLPLPVPITVEGVDIAFPGLFYDRHLAVHGLEGIIDFRSLTDSSNSSGDVHALNSTADTNVTNEHAREYHAPHVPHTPSPYPIPVVTKAPQSSYVIGIDSGITHAPVRSPVASPDISPANRVSVPVSPYYRQPETYSETITQPHEEREEHVSAPSRSGYVSESLRENRLREEHVSAVTSEMRSQSIVQPVSLGRRLIGDDEEEFTQVDDKMIDCPAADVDNDDDSEELKIANVRRGDVYMRELYVPVNIKMTCAHDKFE